MNPIRFGYTLSSEEHDPVTLVENARSAEQAGFEFIGISDHFHPWSEEQVSQSIICGANPDDYLHEVSKYVSAGFENIYIHQVGPNQDGFMSFAENELLPELKRKFGRRRITQPARQLPRRSQTKN